MAKIGYFVLCEDVQLANRENNPQAQPVQALLAPIVVLPLPFLPTAFSLAFSVGVSDININKNHNFKLEIVNTSYSNELAYTISSELDIAPFRNEEVLKNSNGKDGFLQFGGPLKNVIFKKAGWYEAKFYFDGVLLASLTFKVRVDTEGGVVYGAG